VSLQKNSFVARRLFNKSLFGSVRYGYVPEVSDYDGLTRECLLGLFRQQYTPINCTLVVSGKITPEVMNHLERLFGNDWGDRAGTVAASQMPQVTTPDRALNVAA